MQLTLHLEQGTNGGESRSVVGDRFTIGRAAENDWTLTDPEQHLSRQHCIILRRGDGYAVIDVSTNGIVVNGEKAPLGRDGERQLDDGDRLALGDYVLRVELKGEPAVETPSTNHAQWFDPTQVPKAEPRQGTGRIFDKTWIGKHEIGPSDHRQSSSMSRPDKRFRMQPEHRPVNSDPVQTKAAPLFDQDIKDHAEPELPSSPEPADIGMPASSTEALGDPFDEPDKGATRAPIDLPTETADARSPSTAVEEPLPSLSQVEDMAGSDRRLINMFLAGAGLSPDDLDIEDHDEFMQQAGASFANLISGLIQLLSARSTIKDAARIERTILGADGNNPLKFARSTGEGLLAILNTPDAGFLTPEVAIRQGFQDLQEHEMALLEGMQVAVKSLMQRFDPENFEQTLEAENAFATLVAGGRNSKCWKTFKARYKEIASEAERDFLGAVGRDFAEAYERNVHRK